MRPVPTLECLRAELAPLGADPGAPCWGQSADAELSLVLDGASPQQGTQVRAVWNDAELRLLWVVEDTHPWATLTEHDAPLYTEEVVEVFLDPVGDAEAYFEIEVNPNNAVLDACMRRIRSGYRKDFRWHCEGFQSVVRRVPAGWIVEMAIPFPSVSLGAPQIGDRWRVNFTRIDRPPGLPRELSAWSPTGLAQFHVPGRFGVLVFGA